MMIPICKRQTRNKAVGRDEGTYVSPSARGATYFSPARERWVKKARKLERRRCETSN
jgi:hypothetical protein